MYYFHQNKPVCRSQISTKLEIDTNPAKYIGKNTREMSKCDWFIQWKWCQLVFKMKS